MTVEKIEIEALQIPSIDRLRLAEKLLASLDGPDQEEYDQAWQIEVEDRIDAFDRGEIEARDSEQIHREIETRFGL